MTFVFKRRIQLSSLAHASAAAEGDGRGARGFAFGAIVYHRLVTRHTSHVTRRTSHVTRHTSHVTRHTSHVEQRHHPAVHDPHSTRDSSLALGGWYNVSCGSGTCIFPPFFVRISSSFEQRCDLQYFFFFFFFCCCCCCWRWRRCVFLCCSYRILSAEANRFHLGSSPRFRRRRIAEGRVTIAGFV